ncbi:serine/threonine-protein kinase [Saccharopolyspora lacisalsi]|uniref:non-specific serine/threonine protein kinase n=1 Tax=Halosaccharopolyspora lacisalsi TaxID=1000566 RepID=A0A839DVV4_9PSEU|nr:Stk1 family PASTA domain-containing Ser/Thr kinase [Halosaccharopolyspora lacisalsi]MBA8825634.1 serine/threonine-protein kinase [Halosaccharopolyspora lacisalsi]
MSAETHQGGSLVGNMLEGRYRVDSLIARGGMSAVYRGLDTRLDRPVALKVMDAQYSGDRSFVDRFEGEARAAARLHHPDVVAVYDQGVDRTPSGDHVYLVMQLVEGGTLRDLIRQHGRLTLPVATSVMTSVLSALTAAHEAGMIHRDIKPENVLIGPGGSVKVADFGLVRAAASAGTTSGSVILGTVAYLSPEQVTTGAADARTDIYAAGVVLYEMLTGRPPYSGDTALSVAYRHVNDDIPAPGESVPEIPPALDDLVMRATRRDASARPPDAATFLAELQALRRNLGVESAVVPVPTGGPDTSGSDATGTDDGPVTDRFPTVDEDSPPSLGAGTPVEGPRGTRALVRTALDTDRTQDMAAVDTRATEKPGPSRTRRRGRRAVAISTVVVLVLAGLVGGVAWWFGSGRYIEVPRVTGKPQAAAQRVLHGAELTPKITKQYDNAVPAGTVISSSPGQGSRALAGTEITLVISKGKPKVPEVPAGSSVQEARTILRQAKLRPRVDPSAKRYHNSVSEGRVIGVSPAPGTSINSGATVTIVVSKGAPPVAVPDVRGMSRQQAFAKLRQAGFTPYESGRTFAEGVATDHVVSTSPGTGTKVRLKDSPKVGVVLSNAVKVPDLGRTTVKQAQQRARSLGLKLNVRSLLQRPNAVILSQEPSAGSTVKPGTTITVTAL